MIVRSYGDAAVLVEVADADQVSALREQLAGLPIAGVVETMPGLRTVLIRFNPRVLAAAELARTVGAIELGAVASTHPGAVPITVRVDYGGPDLDHVAALTGLSPEQVVAVHQQALYRVVLIGMAPGFYFLAGGDARLHVSRRSTPRTDVAKGAIGLAGDYTGIYPRTGPGGWQLIGRVVDELWHPTRLPAASLAVGTPVTLVAA